MPPDGPAATSPNEQELRHREEASGPQSVIPVVGDFAGPTAIREVGRYLSTHSAPVTAFYLSNVERYLFEQRRAWRRFYNNVAILPYDDRSLFIRSVLNRPTFELESSLSPIAGLIKAFGDGRIRRYQDAVTTPN